MKKVYKKPEIMFESFASSVNIAGDCEIKTNTPHSGICGVTYGEMYLFMDNAISLCTHRITPEKNIEGNDDVSIPYTEDGFDQLCYHIPNDRKSNLFNS